MSDKKKNKRDQPFNMDMDFDEFMGRIVRVPKNTVEKNIDRKKKRKKSD